VKIINTEPATLIRIFFILKLKIKNTKDKNDIITNICPVGVCFVKNDIIKTMGKMNQ
tara:strand:+ start:170 stop:340 length:171 start_codon:yes stop_codon:yes gene_type:complete